jgi:hypothetical protein
MSNVKNMTLGELRIIIREAIEESVKEREITEHFGEKIGDTVATAGVADERGTMDEMEDDDLDEVTPKGYEKIVKGIKKSGTAKNPWAVAWSEKKKGIKPQK